MSGQMGVKFSGVQIGASITPLTDLYCDIAYVDDGYFSQRNPMVFGSTSLTMRHLGAIVELKYP